MEDNIENNKVKIKVSEIISKCKRREDWINFSRELGRSFINYLGLYYPNQPGFDGKFFIQFLTGSKKVRYIFLIF